MIVEVDELLAGILLKGGGVPLELSGVLNLFPAVPLDP